MKDLLFLKIYGSTIPTKSCLDTILHLRKLYAKKITNDAYEDTFQSPSAAAGFVTYSSANGLIMDDR